MPWVVYRLVEIFGVFGNALLFEPARWTRRTSLEYKTRSAERTLVQYIVLFVETTALFGILYFALRPNFKGLEMPLDGLAQSFGVITTSGWPYVPRGEWRFVPLAEVLYGFVIGVTVLARAVASLRLVGALDRDA